MIIAFAAVALAAAAPAQHNVLVVLADDLGVDYVSCYAEGSAPPPTPTIDSLAQNGVLFRNAWAYPSCSPARAAILTGRHPCRTMVGRWIAHPNNSGPAVGTIRAAERTLPELLDLAATGLSHAAIGKWHMHDATFPVTVPMTLGGYSHYTGFLAGQLPDYYSWPRVSNGVEQTTTTYATIRQTDDALAWIQSRSGPWFCYLAYNEPHIPFHVPPATLHTRPNLTSGSANREKYKAMIEALDTELGRLLNTLGPAVVANTHIIFLGDNGSVQNMAEPPFIPSRAKGTPYEGGVNVPLIYSGPACVNPGREVTALACAVDVFSTVMELTGAQSAIPPWLAIDGVSLVPYLNNPGQAPLRTFAFTEEFTGNTWPSPNQNGHATVRNDRYKLINRYNGTRELFDLVADPWETQNLLGGTLTATQQQNYNALLNEIGRMRTPLGRTAAFGSPCIGSLGSPVITTVGTPRFGQSYQPTLQGAPAQTFAILATGLSSTTYLGLPLPRSLRGYGAGPGCSMWVSLDATAGAVTDATGSAARTIAIPNSTALLEFTMLHEWFVFDPTAPLNPLGLVTTGGLAAIFGL
ncbi:MAG: sulfatase-like hydrolase/transferase [Planctomycetes bacterium]|nr:sulfatase-like hydrolase/transferase [Planctomycetota bacterium]